VKRASNPSFCLEIGDREIEFDRAIDLSIPVVPGRSAYAFSLPDVTSDPFRAGPFVGDVKQGGSVNCKTLHFCAHGNGTHTECVGHVVEDDVFVGPMVPYGLMPACVFTISTVALADSEEHTDGKSEPDDRVLSARALAARLRVLDPHHTHLYAVIVRVDDARGHEARMWSDCNPPYFTRELAGLLRDWGTRHVLVELPSIDREDDGGTTPAHKKFFGVPQNARKLTGAPEERTITELIVVPDEVPDGPCLLDLQVAPFASDAAPSRPMLFPLSSSSHT
jgi:arylformamidase